MMRATLATLIGIVALARVASAQDKVKIGDSYVSYVSSRQIARDD